MTVSPSTPHVLLLPGWQNSDASHWQSLWEQRYGYTRVQQHDWQRPLRGDWSIQLQEAVLDSERDVVLVAHSLGCMLTAWWAAHSPLAKTRVAWGSELVDLGHAGHINSDSGLGDWDAGHALLQQLMKD